ncbi:MAG: glycine--tRNA ligase subunit beta [Gammaproteobacteria bacterium]|nr:glycine--tRNA ligase subunit beta [Gammaproteobacteria bacterium]
MTDETRDLLIEIGTEELPPKALLRLSRAFSDGVRKGLIQADLAFGEVHDYAAPRRLAVWIEAVAATQADREQIRRGPALAAAFDDEGNPTPGAQGFARSCGVGVEQLEKLETDKGAWLVHRVMERGRGTAELVPDIVDRALCQLPIPKRMRWGAGTAEFVRPVHWIVLLFGDEVIDAEILGVRSGRETRGHRFHHPAPIYIGEPAAYAPLLQTEGRVLADFAERREAIRGQVIEAGVAAGGRALIDEDLLDEVTALVEWPVAVVGDFETRFLEVPSEALISTMQDNQKYFPVVDAQGRLLPHFITISNIVSRDPAQVKAGNERVVRPRLTDAAFFWNQDRRQRLEARIDRLGTMVFQSRLGTLLDKQKRVARLAAHIAAALGADPRLAERAAMLAKCDLLTQMVFEFPELQGVMGRYYARHDGEPDEVAQAIDEQYRPRFAGDALPETATGQALAIADRLDTLVGIFAIGQPPTGDKDPFALRRAALGVLRILIEGGRDLDLAELLAAAAAGFPAALAAGTAVDGVFEFMMERLRAYYTDAGIAPDVFDAVRAQRPTRPLDFHARLHAVTEFRALPEAESLAAANKRIGNILRKTEEAIPAAVAAERLVDAAERDLAKGLDELRGEVESAFDRGDYTTGLRRLAALREPVDRFFDNVMVMAEDAALRANRLALLQQLQSLFLRAADLSRLQ